MLRPDTPDIGSQRNGSVETNPTAAGQPIPFPTTGGVDIQQELNRLEELILSSQRVPFSRLTLVDEDRLLDQLDMIRLNLPPAFRDANQILQQRDTIVGEAERYAQELVAAAEQQAAQMLDELGIVRQAEHMAQQIKHQTQQTCDAMRAQVTAEIDQMRLQAQRDWEKLRQQALMEKAAIQQDADVYAHNMLLQLEQNLSQMLQVVHNGRQQLQANVADGSQGSTPTRRSGSSSDRSAPRSQPSSSLDRPQP
jgi:F0F1-type ATP synthase membrane subunit b/b'